MFQKDISATNKSNRRRNGSGDKRYFSKTAGRTRKENTGNCRPMRGGIRL